MPTAPDTSTTNPEPRAPVGLPPATVERDVREVGRVVATVLLAGGAVPPDAIARANRGLARLGRPPLIDRDFVVTTPEELAPLIPVELRAAVGELLIEAAGEEPLRRRVASSYFGLWQIALPAPEPSKAPPASPGPAAKIARWLIGALPRHQDTSVPEERAMQQSVYRHNEPEPEIAPPVRDPLRLRVERIREELLQVVEAVERVIIGKRDIVERVLAAMAARGHVLLVDSPGVGKTQLCKAISAAVGVRFGRVQFTPDLLPMDLTGATIYEAHNKQFVFRPGPVFTNILLADEINRATPKAQSALLEVMEERTVTVDGTTHPMAEPFQVLATMNPIDHDGTFALPAAQIDRFMVMLELGYPTPEDEVRVLDTHLAPDPALAKVAPVISSEAFLDWQRTVPSIHASPEVKRAAVDFVNGLRRGAHAHHTVSPRATLAWMRVAQARAMLSGREFVTVEDLLDMAPDVLRHRLWISGTEVRDRLRAITQRGGAR
ncbi:MAG: MoxR family ATPase [Minicystis sp.]